jgi:hypothetical protein
MILMSGGGMGDEVEIFESASMHVKGRSFGPADRFPLKNELVTIVSEPIFIFFDIFFFFFKNREKK